MRQPSSSHRQHEATYVCDMQTLNPTTGERGSSYRGKRILLQGKEDPATVERGSSYRDKRFLHTSLADLRLVSEVGTLTLEPKAMWKFPLLPLVFRSEKVGTDSRKWQKHLPLVFRSEKVGTDSRKWQKHLPFSRPQYSVMEVCMTFPSWQASLICCKKFRLPYLGKAATAVLSGPCSVCSVSVLSHIMGNAYKFCQGSWKTSPPPPPPHPTHTHLFSELPRGLFCARPEAHKFDKLFILICGARHSASHPCNTESSLK